MRLYWLALLSPWLTGGAAYAQPAKPNIVLILSDDQGWTGTSVQMHPDVPNSKSDFYQTPNLEKLAAEGMRFSRAYSAPACTMTRVAIQTGKSPAQNQLTDLFAAVSPTAGWLDQYEGYPLSPPPVGLGVAPAETLIPEWLDQNNAGYTTAHFGKYHIGDVVVSGYDHYKLTSPAPAENPGDMFRVANVATQFMQDRVAADQPFFMQVSFYGIHVPWQSRAATKAKYQALAAGLPPGNRHTNVDVAAMTEDLDAVTGQVIDKITELGIEDNTYIIYASDNGGLALLGPKENEPLFYGKGTVYEGGVRVPMIVKGPGIDGGGFSHVPVTLQDIFATVSDMAGVSAPLAPDVESASLLPLLENGGQLPNNLPLSRAFAPGGELFQHNPHYTGTPPGYAPRTPVSSVTDGDYKLVRIYGDPGQQDTLLLFNLAQNIGESSDPASPLNLADDMPEKTAELLAKLDKWLVDVDASMPYDMAANADLEWSAARPGVDPTAWRSTTDVNSHFRERWEQIDGVGAPTLVRTTPFQSNLGSQAFHFDGNDALSREFFRVSNDRVAPGDTNRSATVEFWMRTDALNKEQVIFESGDGTAGLSITLGDADGDGSHNDLRVRILGKAGQHLTATLPIDQFADPTSEFIQTAAVFNDDNSSRYLEVYLNGALAARLDGTAGAAGSLDWDAPNTNWAGFQHAGLGGAAGGGIYRGTGEGLGTNGGAGPLPFNGGFKGDIAAVNFYNYVLNSADIASRYNAKLDAVGFGVRSVGGAAGVPGARATNVSLGATESNSLLVMQERRDNLEADLSVDAMVNSGGMITAASPFPAGLLGADTDFISYLLHFDPVGANGGLQKNATGSVTFAHDIIGLMLDESSMASSDSMLGSLGKYGAAGDRGLTIDGADFLSISPDRRTLSFNLTIAGNEMAQFRVLTESNIAGDFNGDGVVNAGDLAIWKQSGGLVAAGDVDGDYDTDGRDFLLWQRRLGMTSSSTTTAAAVPEPGALAAAGMAMVGLAATLRRWGGASATDRICTG